MKFVKFPDVVTFPDGTKVRPASLSDRLEHDSWRQFGLYLDEKWHPSWSSDIIPWEDFGLPKSCTQAVDQITAAFRRAKAGEHVEVGCWGGHGRTGTVLACMAILAGVPPKDAVAWVRGNYDTEAVEGRKQEEWVLWFADEVERRGDLAGGKH
jgi:hypothetical protein